MVSHVRQQKISKEKSREMRTAFFASGSTLFSSRVGFTLVELLLYMGLLAIFLVVLTDVLVTALSVRSKTTGAALVSLEGEYIRERLLYDIRRASSFSTPANLGQTASQLTMVIDGAPLSVTLGSNALSQTSGATTDRLHSDSTRIASFSATRIGNGTGKDTVWIFYTIESTTHLQGQTVESQAFSFVGGLR